MHANNVCHFAIQALDVERAKAFYSSVFGWKFRPWGPPEFYLIETGNEDFPGIQGALQKRQGPVGDGANGFECSITVSEVDETRGKIIEYGGEIIHEKFEIDSVGTIVKFCDTEGNIACVIEYAADLEQQR